MLTNYIQNGGWENADGDEFWDFDWTPYANPQKDLGHAFGTVADGYPVLDGARSMRLIPQYDIDWEQEFYSRLLFEGGEDGTRLKPTGKDKIIALAETITEDTTVQVYGHTDNEGSAGDNEDLSLAQAQAVRQAIKSVYGGTVTAFGIGEAEPWATNSTEEGRHANSRIIVKYRRDASYGAQGHQQYAGQTWLFTNPTSTKREAIFSFVAWCYVTDFQHISHRARGLFIQAQDMSRPHQIPYLAFAGYGYAFADAQVPIDEDSPENVWLRLECQMKIPANGVEYSITARIIGPDGTSYWDNISVTRNEALSFINVDQALICKGLVEHAQDPAQGKSSLNIGTNCPLTGVLRTREFEFIDRTQILEALNEFPTLANGVEWDIVIGSTTRVFNTYYPRKGVDTAHTLAVGSNIASFVVDLDGDQVSTRVFVQAEGEGSDREEGQSSDSSGTGGVVFEKVYNATPGSAISSLEAQADRGLERYRKQVIIPSITCLPSATPTLLTGLVKGDRVQVVIAISWLSINAQYRVTSVALDPNTDMLTYTIVPED
jgi:outer membrane protein OmpA-like peptidoglycan-associated protein